MPYLKDDYLTLFPGQALQTMHSGLFIFSFHRQTLEPAFRFQFPRQPTPKGAPIVERAIAERAEAIMLRLGRRLGALHEDHERFLEDIFGFRVG